MTIARGLVFVTATLIAACGDNAAIPVTKTNSATIRFTDHAVDVGLTFIHANGMSGTFLEAEIFAPGVALLDIDNDGDLDLYVVQGGLPGTCPGAPPVRCGDRLFRNDLTTGGALRFSDITASSGIRVMSYGMGVAAGDFDNDGWVDIYRTGLSDNVLLRNNGNQTFADVSARAGVIDGATWSVSASFIDIDRDGWLDLYVTNYLAYRVDADQQCFSRAGAPDYCDPTAYRPDHDRLYHNRGDGTFEDVTARALPAGSTGPALGVVTTDVDGDGWLDLYVANDRRDNDLWLNQRNGTFRNVALIAGAAVNGAGHAEGSMGVDAADADNDGDEDLFVTNFTSEGHTLYVNDGSGLFDDAGARSGIRQASLPNTGFGTAWIDADNDGWFDLITTNGAVRAIEALAQAGDRFPLRQPKQFFRNNGDGRFESIGAMAGPPFATSEVGRGLAAGDIDNDGDMDAVIGVNNGPLQLLINESPGAGHWLGLRLKGSQARPRDMLGARIVITTAGGRRLTRRSRSDGSYASANDPRVLVGLGADTRVSAVSVTWPDGRSQEWRDLAVDQWTTLEESRDGLAGGRTTPAGGAPVR